VYYLNKLQYVGYLLQTRSGGYFSRTLQTQYFLQKKGEKYLYAEKGYVSQAGRECEGIVSLMVGSAILCKDSRSWRCADAYWTRYYYSSPVYYYFDQNTICWAKERIRSTFTINEYGFDLLAHFLSFEFLYENIGYKFE
jgi:hypothetical protein